MIKYLSLAFGLLLSWQSVASQMPDKLVLAYEPEHLNHSQSAKVTPAIKMLAQALGVEIVHYQCPWARCMKLAEAGEVDVVDHLFKTREREVFLTFLNPPYSQYQAQFRFFALKGKHSVSSYQDLRPLSIGVVRGNAYYEQFDRDSLLNKLYSVSEDQLIEMVKLGRVDSFIASTTITDDMIKTWDPDGELVQLEYQHFENKSVHIAVSKQSAWQEHINKLEHALATVVKQLPQGSAHH